MLALVYLRLRFDVVKGIVWENALVAWLICMAGLNDLYEFLLVSLLSGLESTAVTSGNLAPAHACTYLPFMQTLTVPRSIV